MSNPRTFKILLKSKVKTQLENDAYPLIFSTKVSDDAGFFGALNIVFSKIDFLGNLLAGKKLKSPETSKYAVLFMRKYLGQVNPNYKECSGILYHMYRHGLAHENMPKTLRLNMNKQISWRIVKGTPRMHMVIKDGKIPVSLEQFYRDVLKAIDFFYKDLRQSNSKQKKFNHALSELKEPESWSSIYRKGHHYLKLRDYRFCVKRN